MRTRTKPLQSWLVACLAILAGAQASTSLASEPGIATRAMVLLKRGDPAQGYPALEKAFEAENQPALRGQYARILAVGDSRYLKTPRHVYAEYALKTAGEITPQERDRLRRILGDSLFDQVELKEAREWFEAILKASDSSMDDREYATYKLGWIELNLKRPEVAFSLFNSWLRSHPEGSLRKYFSKDAGRAWAEALFLRKQSPGRMAFPERSETPNLGELQEAWVDGILAGTLRQNEPNLDRLRLALAQQSPGLAPRLITKIIEDGRLLEDENCVILSWLADPALTHPEPASFQGTMRNCAKQASPKDRRTHALLSQIYSRVSLRGRERLPRIQAMKLAQDSSGVCRENALLLSDLHAESPGSPESAAALEQALRACRAESLSPQSELFSALSSLLGSKAVKDSAERQPELWYPLLLKAFDLPSFTSRARSLLVAFQSIWAKSKLPLLLLESSGKDREFSRELVARFQGELPENAWRPVILQQVAEDLAHERSEAAEAALQSHFPLGEKSDRTSLRLWTTLALKQPALRPAVLESWRQALRDPLKNDPAQESRDRKAFATLLLVGGDSGNTLAAIGQDWVWVEEFLASDPDRLEGFVETALKDPELTRETLRDHSHRSLPAAILTLLELQSPAALQSGEVDAPSLASWPAPLKKTRFAKEVQWLLDARSLEPALARKPLRAGPRLHDELSKQVLGLKGRIEKLARRRWSWEPYLNQAHLAVSRATETMSARIRELPSKTEEERAQLQALSDLVQSWKLKPDTEGT